MMAALPGALRGGLNRVHGQVVVQRIDDQHDQWNQRGKVHSPTNLFEVRFKIVHSFQKAIHESHESSQMNLYSCSFVDQVLSIIRA